MDDVALANYIAGFHKDNVEAGRVDRLCSELLGVPVGTVIWFSDYTFLKLQLRHGDINFSHYRHMPRILLQGFVARGRKPNLADYWWIEGQQAFFVVLKATRKKEVFVETFHPISLKEARRLLKRAEESGRLFFKQIGADALLRAGTNHLKKKKK
jgi:hypothetical protein